MAPRSGKRRRRGQLPVPIWVPMHRPCLGSRNVPGPYYMPLPEMYLPPWVIPPQFFTKPMCHCANDDFCTTSNCRNSTECLKLNPTFCPHGTRDDEADLQQNTIREDEEYDKRGISPIPDVCSSCGAATSEKRRMSGVRNSRQDNINRSRTNKMTLHEDSYSSLHNAEQYRETSIRDHTLQRGNISNTNTQGNAFSNENNTGLYLPQPFDDCNDSRLRTPYNSPAMQPSSLSVCKNYSLSGNVADLEQTKRPSNGSNSVSTCTGCTPDGAASTANAMSMSHKDLQKSRKNEMFNRTVHIDQLPDQLSQARRGQGSQNSQCCMSPPASASCGMQSNDINGNRRDNKIHSKDSSGSRKASECGCSTTKLTKQLKYIPNLKNNQKATSCECRYPPAYNHLSCNGKRSNSKCHCSSNNN